MNQLILFFLLLTTGFSVFASDDVAKLSDYLGDQISTTAKFEQFTYDASGQTLQTQSGELFLKRPNKFRWQSEKPFEQLLISDGAVLWQYDQDLEQASKQLLDKRISSTPALILSGNARQLQAEYDIYAEAMKDEMHFVLIPKRADALFDRLRLEFNSARQLSRMIIKDEVGQKTVIRLSDVKYSALQDELFEFIAPVGTDIIESQ